MSWVLPPLDVLARWPIPNYKDPKNLNAYMLGVEIPALAVVLVVVGMRFAVRKFMVRNGMIQIDDWLILLATIFATAMTGITLAAIPYGWTMHIWDTMPQNWSMLIKLATATELVFGFVIGFTKLSILAFYYHVFSMTSPTFRKLLHALVVFEIAWVIASTGVSIFHCWPVAAIWDMSVKGKCGNLFAGITSVAVLNSFSDICLFVLPIPWVWELRLPKTQKIGLIMAFGLGLVVIVAGFVRIVYIRQMLYDGGDHDLTWHGTFVYATTAVEVDLGIVCASLPSLKTLFVRVIRRGSEAATSATRSTSTFKRGRTDRSASFEMVLPMKAHIQHVKIQDEEQGFSRTVWEQRVEEVELPLRPIDSRD